jgi:hypothetical protein
MSPIQFYTYEYLRLDGSPYYVGKGSGRRVYTSGAGHRPPKDHRRIGIQYWSDEATAFAYERYLIDFWGRKNNETGILRNLTDGGEGCSGMVVSPETRDVIRKSKLGKTSLAENM